MFLERVVLNYKLIPLGLLGAAKEAIQLPLVELSLDLSQVGHCGDHETVIWLQGVKIIYDHIRLQHQNLLLQIRKQFTRGLGIELLLLLASYS